MWAGGGGGLWGDRLGYKVLDNQGVSNSGQPDCDQTCSTNVYKYSKAACLCFYLLITYLFVHHDVKKFSKTQRILLFRTYVFLNAAYNLSHSQPNNS